MRLFLPLLFTFLFLTQLQADKKANIILIMADDLGYETIGANGSEDYKTPHLDKLATGGMRFTNAFANPLCTPSRVKIMTGLYNVKNYVKFGILDRSQTTFAHLFKKSGYQTCISGKWQLGNEPDAAQHFGFDESCLWQHTRKRVREDTREDTRFTNPRLEINGKEVDYNNGEFGPDICADYINQFISKNKDKPFLVYYPMILTHCPFIPTPGTPDYDSKSLGSKTYKGKAKYFKDMVEHTDKIIGRMVAHLEKLKIRDNTMIIFCGDNGTDKPVVSKWNGRKIAGGKGQVNDYGTRVPFIVNYPGKVVSGKVNDELVDLSDVLPTICDTAGVQNNIPGDGVSLWQTLQGKAGRDKPHVYIWYSVKGEKEKAQIMARTKEYVLKRNNAKAPLKFFQSPEAFKLNLMDIKSLNEKQKNVYKYLKQVIETNDQLHSVSLKK